MKLKIILSKFASRYRSKFKKHKEKPDKDQHFHKTFGFAETPLDPPNKFLQKNCGIRFIHPCASNTRLCSSRRPPIPKHDELFKTQSMQNLSKDKHFKRINIKRTASSARINRPPKFADTKFGDYQNLEKSGMIPIFIHKPKFGKVPEYLKKIKGKLLKQEQEESDQQIDSSVEDKLQAISLEEKNDLIKGLQHNWNLLQKEYQQLSLITDTVPKMLRKTKLENNLKNIERDIVLLNSNQSCIYIKK